MENVRKLLWVDDCVKDVQNWIPFIEEYGCKVDTAPDGSEGLKMLQEKIYDKVLVDLSMPVMDGVEFIKKMEIDHPKMPIAIISAHLDEPAWKRKLKILKKPYRRIQSPLPIVVSPKFETVLKHIFEEIELASNVDKNVEISFQIIKQYSKKDISTLKETIVNEKKDWLKSEIEKRRVEWVVLCGNEIVLDGSDPDNFPNYSELESIGTKNNNMPILFFKDPIVEEISWNSTYKPNDYFPTLPIRIVKDTKEEIISADFDTGAEIGFFDLDDLKSKNIVEEEFYDVVQEGIHLGEKYKYIKKKIFIEVIAENKTRWQGEVIPAIVVKNWGGGVFQKINPKRKALIGRDILKYFKGTIIFDTTKKTTSTIGIRKAE